jgi:hypothetical protein
VIKRQSDGSVVAEKSYRAAIDAHGGEATFETISDPLYAPILSQHADQDYVIEIGFEPNPPSAGRAAKSAGPRRVRGKA